MIRKGRPPFTWLRKAIITRWGNTTLHIETRKGRVEVEEQDSSVSEGNSHYALEKWHYTRLLYYYSEDQYAVSIKEDTAYTCLHSPKTTEDKAQYAVSRETKYVVFKIWNEYNILEDIKRGPYSKKSPIRRIQLLGYAVKMDDPNITMDEYIRLEEEKACRRAIVFNDTLTSKAALSCDPTVSSLNNDEIDFRISFDESDDEDCTIQTPWIRRIDYLDVIQSLFSAQSLVQKLVTYGDVREFVAISIEKE
ncbi:hypothetical protein Tco_0730051 [Tanacetum coccineum]|uniref:Uncharacterized protein n=1 Tax=Tanacetum coccineum TaxID=301880 RepID=A0ABQ4YT52_9ASTR